MPADNPQSAGEGMTQADGRMGLQQILQIENKYETKIATFTCGGL
jgi:hypothetical protein